VYVPSGTLASVQLVSVVSALADVPHAGLGVDPATRSMK
jgi:hypothetical protein